MLWPHLETAILSISTEPLSPHSPCHPHAAVTGVRPWETWSIPEFLPLGPPITTLAPADSLHDRWGFNFEFPVICIGCQLSVCHPWDAEAYLFFPAGAWRVLVSIFTTWAISPDNWLLHLQPWGRGAVEIPWPRASIASLWLPWGGSVLLASPPECPLGVGSQSLWTRAQGTTCRLF